MHLEPPRARLPRRLGPWAAALLLAALGFSCGMRRAHADLRAFHASIAPGSPLLEVLRGAARVKTPHARTFTFVFVAAAPGEGSPCTEPWEVAPRPGVEMVRYGRDAAGQRLEEPRRLEEAAAELGRCPGLGFQFKTMMGVQTFAVTLDGTGRVRSVSPLEGRAS